MLFHNYVETLLGSKVKIKVLRTLWRYKEKEFTIRELAKFLGVSHTGVKKALGDLDRANVIRIRTLGRSNAFKLNANSFGASVIEKVFDMEGSALSELRDMMRRRLESPLVVSAALFGSVVEGRETPRSDIDVLVVTDQKEKVEEMIVGLQKDVSERFGNSISAYYVSEGELKKKRNQSPVKQALENHVLICGKPLE